MECVPEASVGHLLAICGKLCKQRMDQKLRQYGVTPAQAHMILYLIQAEQTEETGEMSQREMGRRLQIKAPTVNGLVERLEEKGFLTRAPGRRDNRCRCLTVTEQGRRLEAEMHQCIEQTEEMMFRDFTAEETAQLRCLLDRMIENLKGGADL